MTIFDFYKTNKTIVKAMSLAVVMTLPMVANASNNTSNLPPENTGLTLQSSKQDVQLQLNKYQIDKAKVQAFYSDHPELFSERFIYTLQELRVKGTLEQIQRVKGHYEKVTTLGELSTWLTQNQIAHKPSIASLPAEKIPADVLPILYRMQSNQVIEIEKNDSVSFIQLITKTAKPKTLEEASSIIKLHLLNNALGVQAAAKLHSE